MDENSEKNTNTSYSYSHGELLLVLLIHFLWILSIINCISKYKKLMRSEQLHKKFGHDNIEGVEIIQNEHDAIIYEKRKVSKILKRKNEIDQIETNFCLNTSKDEIFKLRRRDAIKSSSETQLSIPSTTLRKLLPKQGKSLNQKKHYSIENDIEIKRISTCERRKIFAKYYSKNNTLTNYKNRFEKKMSRNSEMFSSIERSQARSSRIPSIESTNQTNSIIRNQNYSLNVDMIPIQVQRVLLELYANSRANLSNTETSSNLNFRSRNNS